MSEDGKLQFGICIPQMFPEGSVDLEGISSYMEKIRSLGYTSAWVQDGVIGAVFSPSRPDSVCALL